MSTLSSRNSLNTLEALVVGTQVYTYFSVKAAEHTLGDLSHLPCCMRILLENLLRHENETTVTIEDMRSLTAFHALHKNTPTLTFAPSRVLMNDEAGVSVLNDLACLQEQASTNLNTPFALPLTCHTDIVVNGSQETTNNQTDRLALLKWGEENLSNIRIVPPGNGVCSQVNMDRLSPIIQIAHEAGNEVPILIPDSVLGTDPRLPTINSLGVLGWKTDALEIEGILLGYPTPINLPGVVGLKLTGKLKRGTTATDVALAITKVLSQVDCKDKIVEFFGIGLEHLTIADRAIIANFAMEAGALCTYFPIDSETIDYLTQVGYSAEHIALVENYAKAQGLWRDATSHDPKLEPAFSSKIEISLETIRSTVGGPFSISSISQLSEVGTVFAQKIPLPSNSGDPLAPIKHGDILCASLSAYDNISHPLEMVLAGLIARKALAQGVKIKPWVKTSMSDLDPIVTNLLRTSGLLADLEALGFTPGPALAGSASPPAEDRISRTISQYGITVCAVGCTPRPPSSPLHPLAQANYVASAALVVAFALTGTIQVDLSTKPVGTSKDGRPVLLKDLWPTTTEINAVFEDGKMASLYAATKKETNANEQAGEHIPVSPKTGFVWNERSTFVRRPPFLADFSLQAPKLANVKGARILFIAGDDVPAYILSASGPIPPSSPAGYYLAAHNEPESAYLTFGMRTGNYEIMVRGAFTHADLNNKLFPADASAKGMSIHMPGNTTMSVFDVAEKYGRDSVPMVIAAGKNFGHGHGHEWATKSMRILGVRIVIAESFDPTFKLNLVRMGILPLQLKSGVSLADLKLDGDETLNFAGITDILRPRSEVMLTIEHKSDVERYMLVCRIDTMDEVSIYTNGSLLATKLRKHLPLAV